MFGGLRGGLYFGFELVLGSKDNKGPFDLIAKSPRTKHVKTENPGTKSAILPNFKSRSIPAIL